MSQVLQEVWLLGLPQVCVLLLLVFLCSLCSFVACVLFGANVFFCLLVCFSVCLYPSLFACVCVSSVFLIHLNASKLNFNILLCLSLKEKKTHRVTASHTTPQDVLPHPTQHHRMCYHIPHNTTGCATTSHTTPQDVLLHLGYSPLR